MPDSVHLSFSEVLAGHSCPVTNHSEGKAKMNTLEITKHELAGDVSTVLKDDVDLYIQEQHPLQIGEVRWYRTLVTRIQTAKQQMLHVGVNTDGSFAGVSEIKFTRRGLVQVAY